VWPEPPGEFEMEEEKLPWWRRALRFALGGIRSGFGLFSRPPKNEAANGLEIVAGQRKDSEEEAELAEDSPKLEPIAETLSSASVEVAEGEPGSVAKAAEAVGPGVTATEAKQTLAGAEEDSHLAGLHENAPTEAKILDKSEAVEERSETTFGSSVAPTGLTVFPPAFPGLRSACPGLLSTAPSGSDMPDGSGGNSSPLSGPGPMGVQPESSPVAEEPEASAEAVSSAPGDEAAADEAALANEAQTLNEPEAVAEPEVVVEAEVEARIEESEVNEPETETETVVAVEEVAANESAESAAPVEAVEEGAVGTEAPERHDAEPEVHEDLVEAPGLAAVADEASDETAIEASEEVTAEAAKEDDSAADAVVQDEGPQDVSAVEEMVSEPDEELRESAEPAAEVEAVSDADAVARPAAREEATFAEEPVLEEAVSTVELPVESKEPAIEDPPEQTAGQPAANEAESPVQAPPIAEAAPETEPAVEPVAEIDPEPAKISMELNEPIREQEGEPIAASEPAPAAEAASEEVARSEAAVPEAAAEPAVVPAETVVEDSAAATISAEAPPAEAAVEPTVEGAATPVQETAQAAPQKPFIKLESRDNEADLSPFSVVVSQVYDGPLDLLLDLIRKQDIDIYDIPIARITAQFLAYVNQLKATDVDVAGEFIYTASLLIHIKSKMLLPRAPAGPDDAAEDPRRELVERLLEHERFKNAAQMLQQKQMLEAATWTNPGLREFQDDAGAEPEIAADTVDLVRVFRDILERARNRPVINVEEDSVTVGQMIQFLSRRLTMEDKPVALRRLLSHTRSERALIAMFLALLELVRLQAILLRQDRAFSEIFIKKHTGFESVMNEGAASARDDWR